MSKDRKVPARVIRPAPVQSSSSLEERLARFTEGMKNNPDVQSFEVKVNKKTGYIRLNARHTDGRVVTQTDLGPGLQETIRYNPTINDKDDRNNNIITLLQRGLTQTEVAVQLGISQALVSKVYREQKK